MASPPEALHVIVRLHHQARTDIYSSTCPIHVGSQLALLLAVAHMRVTSAFQQQSIGDKV
jgi:hypothetical protein